uniref:Uncharacterized protein n=1 Tax=Arundo donax TaxID=35708 RepID=A0A0A9H7V8_ARUDO
MEFFVEKGTCFVEEMDM